MPGILISHSHHNPKTQGELQDMGMTWARQGCLVLVMDHLGHGERRQHPFRTEADYPRPFRAGRQDYYFRYNTGVQLQLVGESLMGWMVWDLMRGLDLLLARPGIDKDRIILLGCGRRGRRPGGGHGRPRPAGQGGRPVQLRRAAARLRRPRRPGTRLLLVRRARLGIDPLPAAGGAGRLRPLADRRRPWPRGG